MATMIGIDAHRRSHTAVAVDAVGRFLDERTVPATPEGLESLVAWAETFGDRVWAVEDVRTVTVHLERRLLSDTETVLRVPPALTGPSRRTQRTSGKSDPIDAQAVARAALANPDLPRAGIDPQIVADIRVLVDYRDQLVAARTALINQLRERLHIIDPTLALPKSFTTQKAPRTITALLGSHRGLVVEVVMRDLDRLGALNVDINQVGTDLDRLVRAHAPTLVAVPGVGVIAAAGIVAQVGDITRFETKAQFGRYTGTAPIPASSGNTGGRMRLNRGGNRQLNRLIHMAAIAQLSHHAPARVYIDRKTSEGKTTKDALRALKRHIANAIYRALNLT